MSTTSDNSIALSELIHAQHVCRDATAAERLASELRDDHRAMKDYPTFHNEWIAAREAKQTAHQDYGRVYYYVCQALGLDYKNVDAAVRSLDDAPNAATF